MAKKQNKSRDDEARIQVNIYFPESELEDVDAESSIEGPPAPSRSFIVRKLCAEAITARKASREMVGSATK